jgi:hypothetical protein
MDANTVELIGKLADMARTNGPFFFAIALGALWLWIMGKALAEKQKPGKFLVRYLLGSAAGCLIASFAVGWLAVNWWLDDQRAPIGRFATVLRVPNDITLWADAVQLYQQKHESQRSPTHSIRLAFLLKSQCKQSDALILQLNREGMERPDTFQLDCAALDDSWQTTKTFDLDVDEKTGNFVLKAITPAEAPKATNKKDVKRRGTDFALVSSALAGAMPIVIPSQTVRSYTPANDLAQVIDSAKLLQDMRATPGEKLEALGRLTASVAILQQNMTSDRLNRPLSEPLYATLLDLERHSDRQLAVRSRLLLSRLPLTQDLAALAGSGSGDLAKILPSLSDEELGSLRAQAQEGGHTALVAALGKPRPARSPGVPIPTYTRDGDRYFVKASWNNRDDRTVRCIGKAYADVWGGTLAQQTELARTKATRTVYYTKDWSQTMAQRLQACGADVTYVQGVPAAPKQSRIDLGDSAESPTRAR